MSGWVQQHTSESLMLGWFVASYAWLIVASTVIPKPTGGIVGAAGYFTIIICGFIGTDIYIREKVNRYPYYLCIVRPNNDMFHLFVDREKSRLREGGKINSAHLALAYGSQILDLGKKDSIVIHYKGGWYTHCHFRPGTATFNGYNVAHPQTEILELRPTSKSDVSIEYGSQIPVFDLISGSQDLVSTHDMENIEETRSLALISKDIESSSLSAEEKSVLKDVNLNNLNLLSLTQIIVVARALIQRLTQRESQLNETIRSRNEWQQRAHSLEIINQEQTAANRGIMEGKGGVKALAIEMLLTVYEYCHSIDKGLAYLRGRSLEWISKYVFMLLGLIVVVVFLWYNPQITEGFQSWLNNPIVILVMGVVAVAAILIVIRTRKKP